MADVPSTIYNWSPTTGSNSPTDLTSIGAGLADNLQEIQGVVRRAFAHVGANIASATTTDIGAVDGLMHSITGTTTITGLGTVAAGVWKVLVFAGALTLTHNATSLILPGGVSITTAAGDVAIVQSLGSGNWRCLSYSKANGYPLVTPTYAVTSRASNTILAAADREKTFIATAAFTQTLTAAATLGDGWVVGFINNSTGLLVLDPNGSETIDGQTTLSLLPGETVRIVCNGISFRTMHRTFNESALDKYALSESRSGNAMTITLLNRLGLTPSADFPVLLNMRSATDSSGDRSILQIASALTFTVSAGSTLGTISGTAYRLYITASDDSGTPRLGVWNPLVYASAPTYSLQGLTTGRIMSSTAEGGAGGADSAQVLYTGAATTSKAIKILGYLEGSQSTAGQWASAATKVHVSSIGDHKTGDNVYSYTERDATYASYGSNAIALDNTIPQNSEGNSLASTTYAANSACNLVEVGYTLCWACASAADVILSVFSSASADALACAAENAHSTNVLRVTPVIATQVSNSTSSITYSARAGSPSANTFYKNGTSAGQMLGARLYSTITVREIFV